LLRKFFVFLAPDAIFEPVSWRSCLNPFSCR
jgi:hypothetical protein